MDRIPIATLLTLPDKTPIPSTSGTVGYVGDRKSGTNANGEWSVQHVDLLDGEAKIKVSVWGAAEIPRSWKGQQAMVIAGQRSDGKGICGVKLTIDRYQKDGQTVEQKVVEVRDKGAFVLAQTGASLAAAQSASAAVPPPQPVTQAKPPATAATQAPPIASHASPSQAVTVPAAKAGGDYVEALIETREFLARCTMALVLAAEAKVFGAEALARRIGLPWGENEESMAKAAILREFIESPNGTLFIGLNRKRPEMIARLPKSNLEKAVETAKTRLDHRKANELSAEEQAKAAKKAAAQKAAAAAKAAAEEAARLAEEAGAE